MQHALVLGKALGRMGAGAVAQLVLLSTLNLLALLASLSKRSRGEPTPPMSLLRLSAAGWALALGAQSVLVPQARAEAQARAGLAALLCCLLLALHWRCRQQRLARLAALSGTAWALQLWSTAAAVLHQPALQPRALIPEYVAAAACGLSTAVLAAAAVEAVRRQSAEGGREPLLGSDDAEAALGGGKPPSRRWQLAQAVGRYVWPDRAGLRLRLLGCLALVAAGRVVNVAVPIAFKQTIDALSAAALSAAGGGPVPSFRAVFLPWVAAYLGLYLLQGGAGGGSAGLLSNLRALLWLPISQRAYARISLDVFGHLLQARSPPGHGGPMPAPAEPLRGAVWFAGAERSALLPSPLCSWTRGTTCTAAPAR